MAQLPPPSPFPQPTHPVGQTPAGPPPLAPVAQGPLASQASTFPPTAPSAPLPVPATSTVGLVPPAGASVAPLVMPPGQVASKRDRASRRRSRATWISAGLCAASVALIGFGAYDLLASIDLLGVITGGEPLVSSFALTRFGTGVVVSVVAFILAIAATVRSRPRLLPALVLVATLLLPLPVFVFSVSSGVDAFQTNAMSDINAVRETVVAAASGAVSLGEGDVGALVNMDPAQARRAREAIGTLEGFGVDVPHRQEILDALEQIEARGAS